MLKMHSEMENDMKKIGFVIPWYYEDIRGGAEQEMRGVRVCLMVLDIEVSS